MTRCDYDTIFQRVFCVTLVAIAFTFTVILTNVFVDIDGLLSRKDKGFAFKAYTNMEPVLDNEKHVKLLPNAIGPQTYYKADGEFEEESDDNYRSKRSLDSQNFLFHMRNPKMKSILTSRLATLLEELDNEESHATDNKNERPARAKEIEELTNKREEFEEVVPKDVGKVEKRRHDSVNAEEDLLHMAMHNILLQGIIGHMDLNDVYRKIHLLVNNFKDTNKEDKDTLLRQSRFKNQPTPIKLKQVSNDIDQDDEVKILKNYDFKTLTNRVKQKSRRKPPNEENKFLEEIAECDKLQNDIAKSAQMKYPQETTTVTTVTPKPFKLPNVLIKTIIDITSLNNNKSHKQNNSSLKENVKGIIQLIYNGQSFKFSRIEEEARRKSDDNIYTTTTELPMYQEKDNTEKPNSDVELMDSIRILQEKVKEPHNPNPYLNKFINEYLKKTPDKLADMMENPERHKYQSKRYKRQIKIRYQDANVQRHKTKPKRISAKRDDDELYVEIETHFDSKGMKGEKKRKLIRSLIEKIQKAIHSDLDFLKDDKKRKHRRYHVKKRTQHPLDKNKTLLNKIMIPFEAIIQRQSEPISKSVPHEQPLPGITDKSGENWKKSVLGPRFLQVSKSVNSAELGDVDVDYSKVLAANGIPQRLQKPLNIDDSEESNPDTVFDLGNMKFFIKDLDGTGLSIGFNQYMDEPPDPEAMKLFTGIENIIANYHQNDDQTDKTEHEEKTKPPNSVEKEYHGVYKRDVSNNNEHVVIRRSVKELNEKDYHSNEYKIVFDSNYLPYDSYQEVVEDKNKRVAFSLKKENDNNLSSKGNSKEIEMLRHNLKISELPTLLDDNIFHKKLKPSEILNLASILNRRKRGINVKKISNIKNKIKLNKYLNTRRMGTKKLILNNKRNKRQIDKIRIIATDSLSKSRNSDEHFYITSDENVLADRAVIRELETPDGTFREFDMGDEKPDDSYHSIIPFIYEETPIHTHDGKYRRNPLMSKYPHIFMEEVSRSNEEFEPVVINNYEINPVKRMNSNHIHMDPTTEASTPQAASAIDLSLPKVEEIVSAITPQHHPKDNYKLTVRIMPQNGTGSNSGFKEIHTSINKSFNRDGLSYSSLVNVSEISKIEKIHTPIEQLPRNEPIQVPSWVTPKKSCLTQRMEEQQMQQIKMDSILKAHRRRLDDQLEHLKKEKMTLDAITRKNARPKSIETPEFISNKDHKLDISKLLASTLLKFQSNNDFTTTTRRCEITTTPATTTTHRQTQTQTFETTTRATTKNPQEKYKLMHTIQKNENLTNEILHQINKNTEILQMFLSKLADKLTAKEPHHSLREEPHHILREEPRNYQVDDNKLWKPMPLAMAANVVPIPIKNVTTVPLPFVYAFQHPFSIGHKPTPEIIPPPARGHIHAAFHRDPIPDVQNKPKDVVDRGENTSRYFIDNMDNEFVKKTGDNSTVHAALPLQAKNKRSFAQLVGVHLSPTPVGDNKCVKL